ncbi:hypothetical protein CTM53_11920 [Prevotella intermedia]|uniref:Uncharacterized protein n=1 Tax=Prevotella intermedia TaxID=28131 RepID=A0AAJ3RQH2_PREIN|nr:hypothetical protein CTM53_11920 [Prevotella intermedia]
MGSTVALFVYCCLAILKKQKYFLSNKWKDDENCVNIFHKHIYRITALLSTHYKTYCFAFQKRRFCTVKAAVLHRKTYAFATSNRNYRFLSELFLQNCIENLSSAWWIYGKVAGII